MILKAFSVLFLKHPEIIDLSFTCSESCELKQVRTFFLRNDFVNFRQHSNIKTSVEALSLYYEIHNGFVFKTLGLLICTLISENQGIETSRSLSNLRKISGLQDLNFFSVHLSFFFSLSPEFFRFMVSI